VFQKRVGFSISLMLDVYVEQQPNDCVNELKKNLNGWLNLTVNAQKYFLLIFLGLSGSVLVHWLCSHCNCYNLLEHSTFLYSKPLVQGRILGYVGLWNFIGIRILFFPSEYFSHLPEPSPPDWCYGCVTWFKSCDTSWSKMVWAPCRHLCSVKTCLSKWPTLSFSCASSHRLEF